MKSRLCFSGRAAWSLALCFAFVGAHAEAAKTSTSSDANVADDGDEIFDGGFEGENGGTSCEAAVALQGGVNYAARTNYSSNWMATFGPLPSPSNDVVYSFVASATSQGSIMPTATTYDFAMFIIPDCVEGFEPASLAETRELGVGIDLSTIGLVAGHTYYLAVTGNPTIPSPGSNGALAFITPATLDFAPEN
jgi:hypothetical protein